MTELCRTNERPEMCEACGFVMGAVLGLGEPEENDVACCSGCGYPFKRCEQRWKPLTMQDVLAMSSKELARVVILRKRIQIAAALHRRGERPRVVQ